MKTILAALLFPAVALADCPTTSVALTLEPDWEAYQTGSPGAPFAMPMATKDCNGIVRIEAGLRYTGPEPGASYTSNPSTGAPVRVLIFPMAFTLPVGYRPANYEIFPMTTALIPGEININPSGGVVILGDYAKVLTIFSGVTYRAQ